jgi:Bacteriophage CI repressor helix-turn-helix domain
MYALAKAAGLSDETLYAYRRKGTDPVRGNLIKIAVAAGVSVEWLATGKDPIGWDAQRLREVIEGVENHLRSQRLKMKVRDKAELIALVYEEIAEQEHQQIGEAAEPRPERILRLVEKRAA